MTDLFDVSSKSILITGASSGLGRSFAKMLAGKGATVVVAARREEALNELATEIEAAGGSAHVVRLDVTDLASVKKAVAEAENATGGLDALINNSGTAQGAALLEATEQDWDRTIDTNLKGAWAVGVEVARHMVRRGQGGSIVNIASVLGLRQSAGLTDYAVSKAGVIQLTKQMALECARYGIRVNALAPGYFETEINRDFLGTEQGQKMLKRVPMLRSGAHDELAGPMLLLLSDASSYMSGAVISVDGGHAVNSV